MPSALLEPRPIGAVAVAGQRVEIRMSQDDVAARGTGSWPPGPAAVEDLGTGSVSS